MVVRQRVDVAFSTPTRMGSIQEISLGMAAKKFRSPSVRGVFANCRDCYEKVISNPTLMGSIIAEALSRANIVFRSPRVWRLFFNV